MTKGVETGLVVTYCMSLILNYINHFFLEDIPFLKVYPDRTALLYVKTSQFYDSWGGGSFLFTMYMLS